MDIFQGSKALEDAAIQGIEWGLFLRHDLSSPIQAFMILQCGDKKMIRVIADEEDPVSFAKKLLAEETEDFNYVTIGAEVALKNRAGEKEDAILIEAYDVSLEKGVSLCHSFNPKENGDFHKIGNINLIGQPALPIPVRDKVPVEEPEETAVNGLQTEGENGLTNHVVMFTDSDAFQVAYAVRKYLRAKLSDEVAYEFSGKFELIVTPNEKIHREFLDFMLKNVYSEVIEGEDGQHWEESTNRTLDAIIKYDDQIIAAPGAEKEDALEKFVTNNAASTSEEKSGCMKSVAFMALIISAIILLS